jgi:hypothetical protein
MAWDEWEALHPPLLMPEWVIPEELLAGRSRVERLSIRLWCQALSGCSRSKGELIELHRPLALRVASDQAKKFSPMLREEHISEAYFRLWKIIERWEPSRGELGKRIAYRLKWDLAKWRGQLTRRALRELSLDHPDLPMKDMEAPPLEADLPAGSIMEAISKLSLPQELMPVLVCLKEGTTDRYMIARETRLSHAEVAEAMSLLAEELSALGLAEL